jgi:hypothetical protein
MLTTRMQIQALAVRLARQTGQVFIEPVPSGTFPGLQFRRVRSLRIPVRSSNRGEPGPAVELREGKGFSRALIYHACETQEMRLKTSTAANTTTTAGNGSKRRTSLESLQSLQSCDTPSVLTAPGLKTEDS